MKSDKKISLMISLLTISALTGLGCQSVPRQSAPSSGFSSLSQAQQAFTAGDLYVAKKRTELFLQQNPSSFEGQQLMAEILDREISQHKEAFEIEGAENQAQIEKTQIKTLLERSRSLLALGEYDEAARMAETVFTYVPDHAEASRLLDQIRERAWADGKKEIMDGQEIVRAEVDDRASIYRRQAQVFLEEGQWGAAQMSVQKLLLLYPEDREGLQLLDQIKQKQRNTPPDAHA